MAKGRYQYFPVIQNSEKARFNRSFVYLNQREWTDPSGKHQPALCLSITPDSSGMYKVDTTADHAKEKLNVLNRQVSEGIHPIIGPFDSVVEGAIAERKVRPLTEKEELEAFRREKVEREAKSEKK